MEAPVLVLAEHLEKLKQCRQAYRDMAAHQNNCIKFIRKRIKQVEADIESTERAINILIQSQKQTTYERHNR